LIAIFAAWLRHAASFEQRSDELLNGLQPCSVEQQAA